MSNEIKITCTSDHYLNISEMSPFQDNPRELSEIGYKNLKKSILALGVFKPFLIWKRGNKILGGNQRHLLIEDLVNNHGFIVKGPLPITYVDCDEATAKTIVLRDNQSDGDWAYEILADYMNKLEEIGGDLSLTGFSDKERIDLEKLIQTPDELRKDLEDMASETDVDDMLKKNFGISFKVPEKDWEYYQDVIALTKKETKTDDLWVNLKHIFTQLIPTKEETDEYKEEPKSQEIEESSDEAFDIDSDISLPEDELTPPTI